MQGQTQEVGSYKKLGNVEMTTRRMFVDGDLRIFETIQGDYVPPMVSLSRIRTCSISFLHPTRILPWHGGREHLARTDNRP
jgi:hypothetical protein